MVVVTDLKSQDSSSLSLSKFFEGGFENGGTNCSFAYLQLLLYFLSQKSLYSLTNVVLN